MKSSADTLRLKKEKAERIHENMTVFRRISSSRIALCSIYLLYNILSILQVVKMTMEDLLPGKHGVNHVGFHTSPEPQVVQGGRENQ
jgi:hypothetical protein